MNFGILKDTFASILVESHLSNDKQGKDLYKKFLNLLKEDEVLKSQFIVYKNIETKNFDDDSIASNYLRENVTILKQFKKSEIEKANNKLVRLLKTTKHGLVSENKNLHKSFHTLITENKTAENLNKLLESFNSVKNWILNDKVTDDLDDRFVKEGVDPNKFLDIAVKKFNEKYSDITEEEKLILKTLRENDEESIKGLVSKLTDENIKLINQNLEVHNESTDIKEKLLEVKDVVYRMRENNDSFGEQVLKLLELKDSLSHE